jgi:HIRAN domain
VPLFGRRRRRVELQWVKVTYGGGFPVEVRGESFHQPALALLAKQAGSEIAGDSLSARFEVALRREPENEWDPNAVAVDSMEGAPLGHLAREIAGEYSAALMAADGGYRVHCDAGAFGQLHGGKWNIGIWLALPDAPELTSLIANA